MSKYIISDSALKTIIDNSPIDDNQKKQLAEDIESLDNDQRVQLMLLLRDIYALEDQKNQELETVSRLFS
ncbi:MAG: hypothetical protein BWY34_00177 [Parcubacteria group bacterium ADurb.Bin247]|nr:MAG: hypothetical protein BWY34_00177 [Parcubacteria group bacterium ADurb.Bin247]